MKLGSVTITNYGPFKGDHTFALDARGLLLIRGDNRDEPRMNSNGSGKSSLVEAIDWALFGCVPRADTADSVVHGGADGCAVSVCLQDDDGIVVHVRRTRDTAKSTLALIYDGEDVSSLDSKETQRNIEWHLGVDRQVFHSTVLFAQNDLLKFADAGDADRMAILTKVLRLEEIDAWAISAKDLERGSAAARAQMAQKLSSLEGQIEALRTIDTTERASTWEQERTSRLHEMAEELSHANAEMVELDTFVKRSLTPDAIQRQIDALAHDERPAEIEQLQAEHAAYRRVMEQAEALVAERKSEQRRIVKLQQLGDVCPECEQVVGESVRETYANRLKAQNTLVADAQTLSNDCRATTSVIESALADLERKFQDTRVRNAAQRSELNQQLQTFWLKQSQLNSLGLKANRLDNNIRALQAQANPFEEIQAQTREQMQSLDAQCVQARSDLRYLEIKEERYAFWVQACSAKGLKSFILDSRLQEMTDASNAWVKLLTGGTLWVRLESTTPTKAGAIRNKFNIRVFRQEPDGRVTERNFKSWSGGEKQRVSLGIDFGLSRLIAQRARKPWDVLILDEIFRHLDASGREAVMEMLQKLRQEKTTILVVDHDAEFQSMFEHHVTVRKENGCAQIIEGDDVEYSKAGRTAKPAVPTDSVSDSAPRAAKARKRPQPKKGTGTRNRGGTKRAASGERAGNSDP